MTTGYWFCSLILSRNVIINCIVRFFRNGQFLCWQEFYFIASLQRVWNVPSWQFDTEPTWTMWTRMDGQYWWRRVLVRMTPRRLTVCVCCCSNKALMSTLPMTSATVYVLLACFYRLHIKQLSTISYSLHRVHTARCIVGLYMFKWFIACWYIAFNNLSHLLCNKNKM